MREVATAISDEARAKHHEFARRGQRGALPGPDLLVAEHQHLPRPALGPRPGDLRRGSVPHRAHGRRVRQGAAGRRPALPEGVATAKHYAVHSGPETERHVFDARPSERDLYETYLPAFRALVQEAQVASVMGAYNRVNGESASASQRLLQRHPAQGLGLRRLRRLRLRRHRRHLQDAQDRGHAGGGGRAGRHQGLRPRVRHRSTSR